MDNEKKNVVILTYAGLYSLPMVEAMLNNPNAHVVKILNSTSIYGNKTGWEGVSYLLKRSTLLFIIPKVFEKIIASAYTWVLPMHKRPFKTLSELASVYNVDIENVTDVNSYPHARYKGAVLFTSYLNQIVSSDVIDNYELAFNTHPSPLPEGRGMFIQFWLIKENVFPDRYFQSIQWMTKKVDGGDVVIQRSCPSTPHRPSMADYMNKVTALGIEMIRDFDFKPHPETVFYGGKSTYYTFPKAKDVLSFWKNGCSFMILRDIKEYLKIKSQK